MRTDNLIKHANRSDLGNHVLSTIMGEHINTSGTANILTITAGDQSTKKY